jgi:flagellar FliJ protein
MSRFRFRLESVRALREQAESQAKEEFARELALKAERDAELSAAEERLRAARDAGALVEGSSVTASELVSLHAFVERRHREVERAQAGVSAQEAEVGHSRARLEQAARDRALLERLKQRRHERHVRATAKAEEAALGEVALSAHRRAGGEEAS